MQKATMGILAVTIIIMVNLLFAGEEAEPQHRVEGNGTVHVGAFDFPTSSLLNSKTLDSFQRNFEQEEKFKKARLKHCSSLENAKLEDISGIRQCRAEFFYANSPRYANHKARYDVSVQSDKIAGVDVEIFTPAEGVSRANRKRVLINLHGGGFIRGARTISHLESMPISAKGEIKIISIDYRMAPEYQFPAASEDVAAVYRALLMDYKPENIGIYGCSAGGLLTAQSVAWFQKEGLPMPGAVGMFCAAAHPWNSGDSGYIAAAISGYSDPTGQLEHPYFKDMVDPKDPLAFPGNASEVMSKFPPSLLISSTRDMALSSVVHTHSQLIKLGVAADLHVWEGLGHAFFFYSDSPVSSEVYNVVVKFFEKHLG